MLRSPHEKAEAPRSDASNSLFFSEMPPNHHSRHTKESVPEDENEESIEDENSAIDDGLGAYGPCGEFDVVFMQCESSVARSCECTCPQPHQFGNLCFFKKQRCCSGSQPHFPECEGIDLEMQSDMDPSSEGAAWKASGAVALKWSKVPLETPGSPKGIPA